MYAVTSDYAEILGWLFINIVRKSNAPHTIVFIVFYVYSKRGGGQKSICFLNELI